MSLMERKRPEVGDLVEIVTKTPLGLDSTGDEFGVVDDLKGWRGCVVSINGNALAWPYEVDVPGYGMCLFAAPDLKVIEEDE